MIAAVPHSATVRVDHIDFRPHAARISRGGRVTWRFEEEYTPHNVHSVGARRFRSSADKHFGDTYAVRFRKAGTYRYVCTIHPGMKGRVVVS